MSRIVPGISAAQIITAPKTNRVPRSPVHEFNLEFRPFILQPKLIAPVLPGDTLKNAYCTYAAITDPIKHPLLGWWLEHWLFYVPVRSIDFIQGQTYFQDMLLDPAFGELNAGYDSAADVDFYHGNANKPSMVKLALQSIVEEWFRNEGEDWLTNAHLDNIPQVGLMKKSPFNSYILDSASGEPDTLPGYGDLDDNLDELLGSGQATNFAGAYDAYQALVASQVVDITFEDWLKQYGVRMPKVQADEPKPELIRYWKDWQKPQQDVDPADGSIAARVRWGGSYRADKDRRFREPGFVVGMICATPKIYLAKQVGAMSDYLNRSLDWLPAILNEHAFTSLKKFTSDGAATGDGPLGFNPTADYWLDLRDLFTKGDQFINTALTETDMGLMNLPGTDGKHRFVASADVDALFTGAANKIYAEGHCRLNFLSQVVDGTPNA